jgi:hypothetical protein
MPDVAVLPKLLASAPSIHARKCREVAVEAIADAARVDFDAACTLTERAISAVDKLSVADARHMANARAHRELGNAVRGLSAAGMRRFHLAEDECRSAAAELASATGAKPGTPTHAAVCYLLTNPLPEEHADA